MASAVGMVIAAGGIAFANDTVFAPMEAGQAPFSNIGVNWRIVPATAILALILGGAESLSPNLGKGLGVLVLMSVLVIPFGNAGTPLENLAKLVSSKKV